MEPPTELFDLIRDLKYLSLMKVGMKPSTKSRSYWERGNFLNNTMASISRTVNSESRKVTLNFIRDVYDKTAEVSKKYKGTIHHQTLTHNMSSAIDGIRNVRNTYREDMGMVSELDTILESMRGILSSSPPRTPPMDFPYERSSPISIPLPCKGNCPRVFHSHPPL